MTADATGKHYRLTVFFVFKITALPIPQRLGKVTKCLYEKRTESSPNLWGVCCTEKGRGKEEGVMNDPPTA